MPVETLANVVQVLNVWPMNVYQLQSVDKMLTVRLERVVKPSGVYSQVIVDLTLTAIAMSVVLTIFVHLQAVSRVL